MSAPFQPFVLQDGAAVITASGSSAELGNKFAEKAIFYLDVTIDNFTTLDVDIEWFEEASGQWLVLFSFAQVGGVATETIIWGDLVADEYLPGRLRATWALVGTDVTFTVGGEMR